MVYISSSKDTAEARYERHSTDRSMILGEYMIEHRATVRATAKKFGISKSTVHKDVTETLKSVSPSMYKSVREILETNKQERHIRGGEATKKKYQNAKEHRE